MPIFVKKITPVKENFMETGTEEDFKIIGEHFEYLKKFFDEGKLLLAGPCEDAAFGISIFKAENLEEAQRFLENDPAFKKGVMKGEVHPYRLSLFNKDFEF
ncbi:MAG TPA: YciI family protein [Ignavibacteria bacterium]|nr:YciI family protein [Ignavibacteria bacterium]